MGNSRPTTSRNTNALKIRRQYADISSVNFKGRSHRHRLMSASGGHGIYKIQNRLPEIFETSCGCGARSCRASASDQRECGCSGTRVWNKSLSKRRDCITINKHPLVTSTTPEGLPERSSPSGVHQALKQVLRFAHFTKARSHISPQYSHSQNTTSFLASGTPVLFLCVCLMSRNYSHGEGAVSRSRLARYMYFYSNYSSVTNVWQKNQNRVVCSSRCRFIWRALSLTSYESRGLNVDLEIGCSHRRWKGSPMNRWWLISTVWFPRYCVEHFYTCVSLIVLRCDGPAAAVARLDRTIPMGQNSISKVIPVGYSNSGRQAEIRSYRPMHLGSPGTTDVARRLQNVSQTYIDTFRRNLSEPKNMRQLC